PSLNHLAIRPCFGTDPFQQIEDQSLNRIRHGCTSWGCPQVGRGARQTASCRRTSELSIGRRPSELRTPRNRSGGGRLLRRLVGRPQPRSSRERRVRPQSSSRLVRSNRLLGGRPIRAQQTVDVEVVWLPTTHTITPQATLTQKPAALKQAPRPPVVDPDERVHAIDLILSVSPLKYCGHGLAHQSLAPVRLRQVKRQLRPAVYLGVFVKTAGADELIIVLESRASAHFYDDLVNFAVLRPPV